MHSTADVIVVGGGIVGLSAAIAMCMQGFSVIVLDAGSLTVTITQSDPRVYAINQASKVLFQTLGVWERIDKQRISLYRHMHVWDSINGAHIDFDARMVGKDSLGAIIEACVIMDALLQRANELNVVLVPNCTVSGVESLMDGVSVWDNVHQRTARLLIVADGALSKTRDLLKVSTISWPYHQQAIVTTIRTEKPHYQTAYQIFHPDGPLAFLPLADKNECSIVWSTSKERANDLMALSVSLFASELTRAFQKKLGALTIIGARYQFPLIMRHVKQYSGQHWILMGDAAHTIHPLAGLGLNEGLADLAAWVTYFIDDKNAIESLKSLRAYQRQRKYALWKTIAVMEGLNGLFSNSLRPLVVLRGFGLSTCNHLTPLKRLFIEYAAGV